MNNTQPLFRRHKQQHIRSADASPVRQRPLEEEELQQSDEYKTPENIQVKQKSQPTHYNGAFIGVQGDFKSAMKQKRKSSKNLSSERRSNEIANSSNMADFYSREQNFMSVFNPNEDQTLKGRKALMGRLGFNSKEILLLQTLDTGISSSVYQKRYLNNQTEIREDSLNMKKKSESSNNLTISESIIGENTIASDIQMDFGLQNKVRPLNEKQKSSNDLLEKQDQIVETFVSPDSDGFSLDFIQKDRTIDRMRRQYLSKLTYQKVWLTQQEKPKFHETVIIFDWDDTLMCTTFINPSGYKEKYDINGPIAEQLRTLEKVALKILTLSIAHGKTFIITNAAEGWVEYSADRYLPSLVPLLEHITIISARSRYEPHFPDDFTKWKLYAFQETQGLIDEAMITNIIALGDSMMEMDAAHQLGERFSKALIKTVKFREMPKPNELVKQLNLVIMKFQEILNSPKNLTIRLEKKTQQAQS